MMTRFSGWALGRSGLLCSAVLVGALALSGCTHLPIDGPSTADIVKKNPKKRAAADYVLIDLSTPVAAALARYNAASLSATFGDLPVRDELLIKPGDSVSIVFWEVGSVSPLLGSSGASGSTLHEVVPDQVISPEDGEVVMPFVGRIKISGMTVEQAEKVLKTSLHGIASDPQVLVTVTHTTSNQMVVLGDDIKGTSFTLTPNQDRMLDAIAAAGGVQSPVYQAQVKLTRKGRVVMMGLEKILSTPGENIRLHANDVLVVSKNPGFFTMLGALGHSQMIQFQNEHMSLTEAIGTAGGLSDERADPGGVFLFRYEPKHVVEDLCPSCNSGKFVGNVPVVFRLNMRHADAFFIAHDFQMADRDVVFVTNASEVQLAKFAALLRDLLTPITSGGIVARDIQN